MMINESRRSRAHFDLPLVLLVFGLAAFGVLAVSVATFSTSSAEEDTLLNLSAAFEGGRLEVMTMRRYTPGDSTLSGLMLTPSVADADGAPMNAHYTLSATSGIFMKWDALLGTYVTVGTTAESDGETVVWSDQTPAADAKDPVISIALTQAGAQTTLAEAKLLLRVDGEGYLIEDDALTIH